MSRGNLEKFSFDRVLNMLNPVLSSSFETEKSFKVFFILTFSVFMVTKNFFIFFEFGILGEGIFFIGESERKNWAIYLGDPYNSLGSNQKFLQAFQGFWSLACLVMTCFDFWGQKQSDNSFWVTQMRSLFKDFPLDPNEVKKVHHLSPENYIEISQKFRALIQLSRIFIISGILTGLMNMIPTTLMNPNFLTIHIGWSIFYAMSNTFSILRMIVYPFVFLLCVYMFRYKLIYVFVPMKLNQLAKMSSETLIPVRETNTIAEMKNMARLYQDMFLFNEYWSKINGLGHFISFSVNSYILYPIFFLSVDSVSRLLLIVWAILSFLWFFLPYLFVAYMNYRVRTYEFYCSLQTHSSFNIC